MAEVQLVPGKRAFIVGVTGLVERFDMSHHSARKLLREWWEEQQHGGPPRAFRTKNRDGFAYYTTLAELQRHMPAARDVQLVREVKELRRDLEFQTRRVDKLAGEKAELGARIAKLEAILKKR